MNTFSMFSTWSGHNPLTIRFRGSGQEFKRFIETLVEDFNEPKFGYVGELYDEN